MSDPEHISSVLGRVLMSIAKRQNVTVDEQNCDANASEKRRKERLKNDKTRSEK